MFLKLEYIVAQLAQHAEKFPRTDISTQLMFAAKHNAEYAQ